MPVLPVTPGIGMMAGERLQAEVVQLVLQLGGKRFRNVDYGVFASAKRRSVWTAISESVTGKTSRPSAAKAVNAVAVSDDCCSVHFVSLFLYRSLKRARMRSSGRLFCLPEIIMRTVEISFWRAVTYPSSGATVK